MLYPAVPITALACALGWLPVLLRFFRSWRARGNPISLAICILVMYTLYIPVYMTSMLSPSWPLATMVVVDLIACVTFYVTFYYAAQKFPDTRTSKN